MDRRLHRIDSEILLLKNELLNELVALFSKVLEEKITEAGDDVTREKAADLWLEIDRNVVLKAWSKHHPVKTPNFLNWWSLTCVVWAWTHTDKFRREVFRATQRTLVDKQLEIVNKQMSFLSTNITRLETEL